MQGVELAASVVAPMWQAQSQHSEAIHLGNELHAKSLELQEEQHREAQKFEHILHKHSQSLEKELHYGQMSHDMEIARREGTRDVWSQRNQLIQTLMVVDTLMFACAFAIVVQGDPPPNTETWLIRLYSLSLGTSLAFLFVSIWLSLKLQTRMAHYDMHRPSIVYCCGSMHLHFNDYYRCHCQRLSQLAFVCYYIGTAATISDAAIFAFTKLYWEYNNVPAGVIFVVISAIAMAVPAVGRYIWPASTAAVSFDDIGGLGGDAQQLRNMEQREAPEPVDH